MRFLKIINKYILTLAAILFTVALQAQDAMNAPGQPVEMADNLRSNGKIYVVVTSLSIIFIGIVVYLLMLDRKVKRLENMLKNK
jgi:CcmD family protein